VRARVLALLVGVPVALALSAGPAAAVGAPEGVTVSIEPASANVVLGDTFDVEVSVTNTTGAATEPLAVHLDVTDPAAKTSVDPEDWTPTLNRSVGGVAAGETATVRWTLQPIAGGTFAVYAVALSQGSESLAASNVHLVTVQEQRSLNPSGILPLAVGAPALIGALLLVQVRRSRRR
jgi:hypothetical protein